MSEQKRGKKFESRLKKFMTEEHRQILGGSPTYHSICVTKCGVARPGKTARDKYNG